MRQPVDDDAKDEVAGCSSPDDEDAAFEENGIGEDAIEECSKPDEEAALESVETGVTALPRNTNKPEDVAGDASEAIGEHEELVEHGGEVSEVPGAAAGPTIPTIPPGAEGGRVSIGCAALGAKAGPGAPIRCPPRARNRFAPSMVACFSASA